MNSPDPVKTGWTPTVSTAAGGALGLALAQIIIAIIQYVIHQQISSEVSCSIGTVCTAAVGYLFPEGGRK